MRQIKYVLQFVGHAAPVAGSDGVLKASTTAKSLSVETAIGYEGVHSALKPLGQGEAFFESEVRLTGESSFLESGTIRFGKARNMIRFSTVGQGYLGASAEPGLQHGSVIWKVDGGEGEFAGATGLITSNFTLKDGEVTDNHFGVIFIA